MVTTPRPPHGGLASAVQDDDEPTATDPGTHFDWWNTRAGRRQPGHGHPSAPSGGGLNTRQR